MAKLHVVVLTAAALVALSQAAPAQYKDVAEAAFAQDWDEVQRMLQAQLNAPFDLPFNFNVKDLKPVDGGKVYGESSYTYQTSSNVDGKQLEQSGGHKIINDNGQVQEYDIKPKLN